MNKFERAVARALAGPGFQYIMGNSHMGSPLWTDKLTDTRRKTLPFRNFVGGR